MKKRIILTVFSVIVLACVVGLSARTAIAAEKKREISSIEDRIGKEVLESIGKIDSGAVYIGIEKDEKDVYYSDAVFAGENYKIWVDTEKAVIEGFISNKSFDDKDIAGDDVLVNKARALYMIAFGLENCEELSVDIYDNIAVKQVELKETNEGVLTGNSALIILDPGGNALAGTFVYSVQSGLEVLPREKIIDGAIRGLESYGLASVYDGDEKAVKLSEKVIAGYVYFDVFIDRYVLTVEGWTGNCILVDMLK